jgi:phosphopentomutase
VVEFDQSWGHRNDVAGFHEGLRELDEVLAGLLEPLRSGDLMVLTADHGNDPTTPSTDHSREAVPLLVAGPGVRAVALGERAFADVGATIADYFSVPSGSGRSFLGALG